MRPPLAPSAVGSGPTARSRRPSNPAPPTDAGAALAAAASTITSLSNAANALPGDALLPVNPLSLDQHKDRILSETKNVSSFVVIGQTLHKLYYQDKLVKTQREFLEWTKRNLGFSKSTTYEYIISYKIYSEIASKLPPSYRPPMYQSHCQLLSKIPEESLVDTWVAVCDSAPNGVITTAFLETFLEEHNLKAKPNEPHGPLSQKTNLGPDLNSSQPNMPSPHRGPSRRISTAVPSATLGESIGTINTFPQLSSGGADSIAPNQPLSASAGTTQRSSQKRQSGSAASGFSQQHSKRKRPGTSTSLTANDTTAAVTLDAGITGSQESVVTADTKTVHGSQSTAESEPEIKEERKQRQGRTKSRNHSDSGAYIDTNLSQTPPLLGRPIPWTPRSRRRGEATAAAAIAAAAATAAAVAAQESAGGSPELPPYRRGSLSDDRTPPKKRSRAQRSLSNQGSETLTQRVSPNMSPGYTQRNYDTIDYPLSPSIAAAAAALSQSLIRDEDMQADMRHNMLANSGNSLPMPGFGPSDHHSHLLEPHAFGNSTDAHRHGVVDMMNAAGMGLDATEFTPRGGSAFMLDDASISPLRMRQLRGSLSSFPADSGYFSLLPSSSSSLPFNEALIYELGKSVVLGQQFDICAHNAEDFKIIEQQVWYGRLWCNLATCRPFSTSIYLPQTIPVEYGGLERLLQIIFTKFANKEFVEGLFLIRGEFGADWFTPILQHPFCILRHLPLAGWIPSSTFAATTTAHPTTTAIATGTEDASKEAPSSALPQVVVETATNVSSEEQNGQNASESQSDKPTVLQVSQLLHSVSSSSMISTPPTLAHSSTLHTAIATPRTLVSQTNSCAEFPPIKAAAISAAVAAIKRDDTTDDFGMTSAEQTLATGATTPVGPASAGAGSTAKRGMLSTVASSVTVIDGTNSATFTTGVTNAVVPETPKAEKEHPNQDNDSEKKDSRRTSGASSGSVTTATMSKSEELLEPFKDESVKKIDATEAAVQTSVPMEISPRTVSPSTANASTMTTVPAAGASQPQASASTTLSGFESYVVFYLGPNVKDFCSVFRSVGLVPGVNSWSAVTTTTSPPHPPPSSMSSHLLMAQNRLNAGAGGAVGGRAGGCVVAGSGTMSSLGTGIDSTLAPAHVPTPMPSQTSTRIMNGTRRSLDGMTGLGNTSGGSSGGRGKGSNLAMARRGSASAGYGSVLSSLNNDGMAVDSIETHARNLFQVSKGVSTPSVVTTYAASVDKPTTKADVALNAARDGSLFVAGLNVNIETSSSSSNGGGSSTGLITEAASVLCGISSLATPTSTRTEFPGDLTKPLTQSSKPPLQPLVQKDDAVRARGNSANNSGSQSSTRRRSARST